MVGTRTDYSAHRYAQRYAKSRRLPPAAHHRWVIALEEIADARDVHTVLDLGAGAGRFWPVFQEAWQPDRVVAIDRSREMLSVGTPTTGVVRAVADMDALPLAADVVDVCFCSMVLHYSPDSVRTLRRLSAHLRPGGLLVVRTGTTSTVDSYDFLRYFPSARATELGAMPTLDEVQRWLSAADFDDIEVGEVVTHSARCRREQLSRVARRGFPSLQMTSRYEFVCGTVRYAAALLMGRLRGAPMTGERVMVITARRR